MQRATLPDEEEASARQEEQEEAPRLKAGDSAAVPRKRNRTGLPDSLKSGVESLSGLSLDNVKVHYNSSQAAQRNALAYAQGTDIHVAPGQEKHLPHEAWHTVQQAQGRVRPTMQMQDGVPINADRGLEQEADVMGARAISQSARSEGTPALHGQDAKSGLQGTLRTGAVMGGLLKTESVAPVAQFKLNMASGYTEALNWSGEAQELIETYEKFEKLTDTLKELMVGPQFRKMRANRLKRLLDFRTALEQTQIPNDATIRKQKTAEIEGKIPIAEALLNDVHAKLGTTAPREDAEIEGEAEQDVTLHSHGERETASSVEKTMKPNMEAIKKGDISHSIETDATKDDLSNLIPRGATKEEDEESSETGRLDKARDLLSVVNIKLLDGEAEASKKGRAGEASAKASGALKANSKDGLQAEGVAEISVILGKQAETTLDRVSFKRGPVSVRTKVEGTVGATGDASVQGGLSVNEKGVSGGLKGKASAFVGGSASISPQIRFLSASNAQIAQVTATGGVSYGIGGSYEGEISWEGGKLKIASKGKLSAGLGLEFGVSGEIDVFAPWRKEK